MRVLVTGATGSIGRQLIRNLIDSGVSVRASSRLSRQWPADVEGRIVDVLNANTLALACDGVDVVIHLAGSNEVESARDPMGALMANAGGTLAWLSAASAAGTPRFVLASTSKVYGADLHGLVTEDTKCQPRSHYALTRRASEDYVNALSPHGVIMRISNGFGSVGPHDDWTVLVNEFCWQAVHHRCIVIRSDGRSWRNIVPVSDVAGALQQGLAISPGTYNVGSACSMPIRVIAELVADVNERVWGRRPSIRAGSRTSDDEGEALDYSIEKLRRAGFRPRVSIEDEIARTLRAAADRTNARA